MLAQVYSSYKGVASVTIIDDCSTFPPMGENFFRTNKRAGKRGFWQLFGFAFSEAKKTKHDYYLFTPDDFLDVDFERIKNDLKYMPEYFVLNLMRDKREMCWRYFEPQKYNDEVMEVGFTDCGFVTNRATLARLGFEVYPEHVSLTATSSGVGKQLTNRLAKIGARFFVPYRSYVSHGEHESKMHPEERKLNPLKSL
jgi:hypothetical protein